MRYDNVLPWLIDYNFCFSQRTPLHVAAEAGRVVTVECIVKTNPDIINIQDKEGVNIWDYTTEIGLVLLS